MFLLIFDATIYSYYDRIDVMSAALHAAVRRSAGIELRPMCSTCVQKAMGTRAQTSEVGDPNVVYSCMQQCL